jgi:hypothetical protein
MGEAAVTKSQARGLGVKRREREEDWREVARHAVRAEAARRGLGRSYDAEADREGIASALIEALARWRREGAGGTEGATESPAFVLPQVPPADLLCARSMRCPSCGQSGGRYIFALPNGSVLALDGDLAYACPEGEGLAEISALCGTCGETAPLGDFRQG